LADAIEAEVSDFLDRHSRFLTEEGQQRLVRHGHLPEREIMTGIGPVGVRAIRHDWGFGCGTCPACKLRADGWQKYKAAGG
jgi:hypothetical protein